MAFQEENIAGKLLDVSPGNDFLTPNANNQQLGPRQTTKLHSKGNNEVKRQPTKWKTIFANHISNTGVLPNISKALIEQQNKTENTPKTSFTRGKGPKQTFPMTTYERPAGLWEEGQHRYPEANAKESRCEPPPDSRQGV